MTTNTAQIKNPSIHIKPSEKLKKFLLIKKVEKKLPSGIINIIFKNKIKEKPANIPKKIDYLITDTDRHFINSLNLDNWKVFTEMPFKDTKSSDNDKLLDLQDLHWLYKHLTKLNKKKAEKIYLHELLDGSQIVLPKNVEVPRNKELERRCKVLKAQQANKDYHSMTKNVDVVKKKLPEDTFGYQIKQMNRHLMAILQFIISVAAGFAFGFIGVELMSGSLDFGFRLLLGIICALTIALAELYFLAKKLNEDLQFEENLGREKKNVKLD